MRIADFDFEIRYSRRAVMLCQWGGHGKWQREAAMQSSTQPVKSKPLVCENERRRT
jgi:hypothetical protein